MPNSSNLEQAVSWPSSTDLVFNSRGQISLKEQSAPLQKLLLASIKSVRAYALFSDAFPEIGNRIHHTRKTLHKCAKNLKLADIQYRLSKDTVYAGNLATIVCVFIYF